MSGSKVPDSQSIPVGRIAARRSTGLATVPPKRRAKFDLHFFYNLKA
jgi:hypothetical protein